MSQLSCPKCGHYNISAKNTTWLTLALWYTFLLGWEVTLGGALFLFEVPTEGVLIIACGIGPLLMAIYDIRHTTKVKCDDCGYCWDCGQ
jgi:predicted nucleic-acid-binding Zn-ribbon protein